ncbi:hypothetical protein B9Z19DRAFT_1091602 [Tuber borchii]|uniref:Uncharacterized protein n=1 Tax=Tuber borchii TaxID=42251 RepID=A0A2T6ZHC3_TUBBO|nr:hypothetical protein B9Z19DRAFT_1091602 [Tuber borchii]
MCNPYSWVEHFPLYFFSFFLFSHSLPSKSTTRSFSLPFFFFFLSSFPIMFLFYFFPLIYFFVRV